MNIESLEKTLFDRYLRNSEDEAPFENWLQRCNCDYSLIVTKGFEERSIGILQTGIKNRLPTHLALGDYKIHLEDNSRHGDMFNSCLRQTPADRLSKHSIDTEGNWVIEALKLCPTQTIVFDITGISNRALFSCLDALASSDKVVYLAYSEARTYYPTREDWLSLTKELAAGASISDAVDSKPWIVGYSHNVEFIPGHDGYDTAGRNRTLVGFLPFKPARISAILSEESYANFVFIAGRPRLEENQWRLEALKQFNVNSIKSWPVIEMDTFGYRGATEAFSQLLLKRNPTSPSLLEHGDVHVALLGSKLQTVACWISSCILPCLSMVISVPSRYYAEAFSKGIGTQWIFPLLRPNSILKPVP